MKRTTIGVTLILTASIVGCSLVYPLGDYDRVAPYEDQGIEASDAFEGTLSATVIDDDQNGGQRTQWALDTPEATVPLLIPDELNVFDTEEEVRVVGEPTITPQAQAAISVTRIDPVSPPAVGAGAGAEAVRPRAPVVGEQKLLIVQVRFTGQTAADLKPASYFA